jgi:hypothetical protein
MAATFKIRNNEPTTRRPPRRSCIYCGKEKYRERDDRKLGEEHVIPESLGGTLAIEQAACEDCEQRVNEFEQTILKTVLYAPRVHLGVRRKRRKRGEETIKVQVGGRDVEIFLPIKNIPVLLFFLRIGPPGLLVGRPADFADMRGVAFINLTSNHAPMPLGFQEFASPVLDTFKFCQFLAKIAHCFASDALGDTFTPTLVDFIRSKASGPRFDLIGGLPDDLPASDNLHELSVGWELCKGVSYAVVKVRLFANLGMPTYLVVAGKAASETCV